MKTGNSHLPGSLEGDVHHRRGRACNLLADWAEGQPLEPEFNTPVAPDSAVLWAGLGSCKYDQRLVSRSNQTMPITFLVLVSCVQAKQIPNYHRHWLCVCFMLARIHDCFGLWKHHAVLSAITILLLPPNLHRSRIVAGPTSTAPLVEWLRRDYPRKRDPVL
jgi:hypothetical protein